jgi:hypothetical protein
MDNQNSCDDKKAENVAVDDDELKDGYLRRVSDHF